MGKKKWNLLGILFAAAAVAVISAGCAKSTKKSEEPAKGEKMYHQLTQKEAKERMDSGDPVVILDVRTREEYDEGHIKDAILLPNENISTKMPSQLPDKDAEILVYCRSGNRSAQAAKKLAKMGYTAVYDFGGINSWNYGVVKE